MTQEQALQILKTGVNVFMTGEPGSGKTHTVNSYISYLREHGIEPAITASTGIAATHIGGMTIHSWSGIGIKKDLSKKDLHNISSKSYLEKRIKKTKVLLIDEISMLDAKTLSAVDLVCRNIKENERSFGGMQVVLIGDFFQLPPVVKEEEEPYFAFQSNSWKDLDPTVCYISEQHRQKDKAFLSLLNAVRTDNVDSEHYVYMESRMQNRENIPKSITKLFSHNTDVDRVNNIELEHLSEETHSFKMRSAGRDALVGALKNGCLSPEELYLKKGAVVMFTKNNPKGKFVNGTLGKVVDFEKESGFPIIKTHSGHNIQAEPMEWSVEENAVVKAKIIQIPLRLAWAITIHKSQGMSMDAAIMDLGKVFEYGQGYVALSRVRELSGLYLLGLNEHALLVHPEIIKKDQEFRDKSAEVKMFFEKMLEKELQQNHKRFILSCGGNLEKKTRVKKEKINTYEETFSLFREGKSVKSIAKMRGLKESTILNHLEALVENGKIKIDEIKSIIDASLLKEIPIIHAAFRELETTNLSPVFDELNGAYSYDELRLARMMLEK